MKRYSPLFEKKAGKTTGYDTYIHRSAVDDLKKEYYDRYIEGLKLVPKNWKYDFVIATPKYIAYTKMVDFDKIYEPIFGDKFKVYTDGKTEIVKQPNKPMILHQRYKTVKPDYKGFDIQDDINRHNWYKGKIEITGSYYLWHDRIKELEPYDKKRKY